MKTRAEKKIQIAIDKLIDLQDDYVDDVHIIERALDMLRVIENRIMNVTVKDGILRI